MNGGDNESWIPFDFKLEYIAIMKSIFPDSLSQKKILVIGDLMLDRYVRGSAKRISPEAPVPVVIVDEESALLGGAANVANGLAAMGVQTTVMSSIGDDEGGHKLLNLLAKQCIETKFLMTNPDRKTTIKTRIVAGQQQIVRVDHEQYLALQASETEYILTHLKKHWSDFDAIILSDYGKGILAENLLNEIRSMHQKDPKIITVDPKDKNLHKYRGFTLCTPNENEAEEAIGMSLKDKATLLEKGQELRNQFKFEAMLITLGRNGMVLYTNQSPVIIPTRAQEVFDVTGAGDTVIAVLSAGLTCGLEFIEASKLANLAAGIVVGKLGAATVDSKDIEWIYNQLN